MEQVKLPLTNDSGYYEIRLESIGGLGANLCGKMLGELGLRYLGLNSASFSSYGSEKTGTPVKAYIRYCDAAKEIRVHAPVESPHILAVFHEALLGKGEVLRGCTGETRLVVNTSLSPKEVADKYNISCGEILCLPAQSIAIESKSRINVVMLGAVGKVMGFAQLEQLESICRDTVGKKYPDAMPGNLEGIRRGYEELGDALKINSNYSDGNSMKNDNSQNMQDLGYETAPIGGIIPWAGNSVLADVSPSRQGYIPIFRPEKCINCALCDSTCPDMVFQFQKGVYKGKEMMVNKGLDYYHCKGCLRCVAVCPTQALVTALEDDYPQKPYFLPNQELIRMPDGYEKTGANGYVTSESYLTEERIDGGEV